MPGKEIEYSSKQDLFISRYFEFGQVFYISDDLIQIPDADRIKGFREIHKGRTVIIISNNKENMNKYSPIITVAPLSTRIDLIRKFDIELYPDQDGVKERSIVRMQLMQPVCKIDLEKYVCTVSVEKRTEIQDAYLQMICDE